MLTQSGVSHFDTAEVYGPVLNEELLGDAWKLWIVLIPGTTKFFRLEENLGAANVEITTEDAQALEEASSKIKLEEARYPKFHEQLVGW